MRELDLSLVVWRKSSYSNPQGGECVEVGWVTAQSTWRKSSYSNPQGGACVEVRVTETRTAVRDSKNAPGPALTFPAASWAGFLARA